MTDTHKHLANFEKLEQITLDLMQKELELVQKKLYSFSSIFSIYTKIISLIFFSLGVFYIFPNTSSEFSNNITKWIGFTSDKTLLMLFTVLCFGIFVIFNLLPLLLNKNKVILYFYTFFWSPFSMLYFLPVTIIEAFRLYIILLMFGIILIGMFFIIRGVFSSAIFLHILISSHKNKKYLAILTNTEFINNIITKLIKINFSYNFNEWKVMQNIIADNLKNISIRVDIFSYIVALLIGVSIFKLFSPDNIKELHIILQSFSSFFNIQSTSQHYIVISLVISLILTIIAFRYLSFNFRKTQALEIMKLFCLLNIERIEQQKNKPPKRKIYLPN